MKFNVGAEEPENTEMVAGTASLFLLFSVFMSASGDQQIIITAEPGQDVTLTCRAPNNNITAVEWSRADLGDENVLLYRNGTFVPDNQHRSFKNRVDLQDRQMKDGDVSLILKNVTINDEGTYVCGVFMEGTQSSDLISIIYLIVVDPPGQRITGSSILRAADKIITAESGQDVTLTCRAPNNNIIVVEWSRADLGYQCWHWYQNGYYPNNLHPSFKNRVDLQDRQMKDGDVSLILRDVTINDTGTYECLVTQVVRKYLSLISIIHLIVVDPPEQSNITAKSGQDVTLPCRPPNNIIITGVEWNRDDLGTEFVLLYRDELFVPDNQHPFFKNRVDLQDRQMKDGDVSLILKDVTTNDAGTYECHVVISGTKKKDVSTGPISSIHLSVVPSELKIIPAESGQDVTLTCRAPNNKIRVVEWKRTDLGDENVLLYQDGHFDPTHQHPSFKNRVDLHDSWMKDGDVSLILKNLTINDTGTYECRVSQNSDESPKVNCRISLRVTDKVIIALSGQDVGLPFRAPNNNIIVVHWSRADLGDEYVLVYQNGQFVPDDQHPSFKNRSNLQGRQMKDGDVSLILKNVTINDTGTYECRVQMNETLLWEGHSIYLCVFPPPDQKTITAESGQNVTLPCRAPNNNIITGVKWNRSDLGEEHVLFNRNGHFDPANQHPSFKNRVDLQDRQTKNGNMSLILKDVTIYDAGTYECCVFINETWSLKLSTNYLVVVPPGPSGGIIALIVVVLLLLVGVGFLIYRKHKVSRYSYEDPTENNEAPQSPQQDCVRGQTEVNYPEPPADEH